MPHLPREAETARPSGWAFRLRALVQPRLYLPKSGNGSVFSWGQGIMEAMLQVGAVFGPLAYLPSVIISVHKHLWNVALVDTLTYGWIVAAALCPHWPYATRVRAPS